MQIKELTDKLAEVFYQRFPESQIAISNQRQFYNSIWLTLYLSKDANECLHQIRDNDMLHISFRIEHENGELEKTVDENTEINFNLQMTNSRNSYFIKPPNSYLVYGRRALSYRKTTGGPEKIIEAFRKFTDRLKTQLFEDLNGSFIHDNFIELVKKKLLKEV